MANKTREDLFPVYMTVNTKAFTACGKLAGKLSYLRNGYWTSSKLYLSAAALYGSYTQDEKLTLSHSNMFLSGGELSCDWYFKWG